MSAIYDEIKADHDEAREMMAKLADTTERAVKTRERLFEEFKIDMWAHHKVEEAVFYAVLKERRGTKGEAFEAINEHHVANGLLEELDSFPVDSVEWGTKFGVLKEFIEHHMEEEEEETFVEARDVLSDDEANEFGNSFRSRKKVVMAALKPIESAA